MLLGTESFIYYHAAFCAHGKILKVLFEFSKWKCLPRMEFLDLKFLYFLSCGLCHFKLFMVLCGTKLFLQSWRRKMNFWLPKDFIKFRIWNLCFLYYLSATYQSRIKNIQSSIWRATLSTAFKGYEISVYKFILNRNSFNEKSLNKTSIHMLT